MPMVPMPPAPWPAASVSPPLPQPGPIRIVGATFPAARPGSGNQWATIGVPSNDVTVTSSAAAVVAKAPHPATTAATSRDRRGDGIAATYRGRGRRRSGRRQPGGKATASSRATMAGPMDDPLDRTVHIDLDLELHREEVQGRAAAPGRPRGDFEGWVGLLAALDELVAPPTEPPG